MKKIAIFASGTGSNAKKIIEHFQDHEQIRVALVISNKAAAPVLTMAENHGVATLLIDRQGFYHSGQLLEHLQQHGIDFIVLAGFLWLVPAYLVEAYQGRMINIHPALLPKYGGKGMYGMRVHQAVRDSSDTETGITIHYVNEQYDEGDIIFQARCPVNPEDTPETIVRKVHELEYRHFAPVIESLLVPKAEG